MTKFKCKLSEICDRIFFCNVEKTGKCSNSRFSSVQNSFIIPILNEFLIDDLKVKFDKLFDDRQVEIHIKTLNKGETIEEHLHYKKSQDFMILQGTVKINSVIFSQGYSTKIQPGIKHTLKNVGFKEAKILIIEIGENISIDDIDYVNN